MTAREGGEGSMPPYGETVATSTLNSKEVGKKGTCCSNARTIQGDEKGMCFAGKKSAPRLMGEKKKGRFYLV